MKYVRQIQLIILIIILISNGLQSFAQELYSAKGYWEELNNENYKRIIEKKSRGETLSSDESGYLEDYEAYLNKYYQRMSEEEKLIYEQNKDLWGRQPKSSPESLQEDFSLRTKDRLVNGIYGAYYGASLVAIMESDNAGVNVGVPLIMAGLWQLGPVINPKKYENISVATIRAGNSGKFLGLIYGGSLGLAIGGDSDNSYKGILGLSTLGSIGLGEIAFQQQKKKQLSEGYVEMIRHYGILGPGVGLMGYLAIDENTHVIGASLLAGGVAGVLIGNKVAKKYDYSPGDVDAISSLTLITTGLGFTAIASSLEDESNRGLILIPTATAIAGTVFGQRSVRGAHLSRQQGSTVNLATSGAALIGLGIVAITQSDAPAVWIGVPSALALVMHQTLFHSYKKKNMENSLNMGRDDKNPLQFSVKVMPENYFANKQLSDKLMARNPQLSYPIVKMKLVF